METEAWTRNSFDVEAVQVTEENIYEVAHWCSGAVARSVIEFPKLFIAFAVRRDQKHNYVKVWAGDWIILVNGEFKHYRNKSFQLAYHPKAPSQYEVIATVLMDELQAEIPMRTKALEEYCQGIARKIVDLF